MRGWGWHKRRLGIAMVGMIMRWKPNGMAIAPSNHLLEMFASHDFGCGGDWTQMLERRNPSKASKISASSSCSGPLAKGHKILKRDLENCIDFILY
jgi:hypothetical protein